MQPKKGQQNRLKVHYQENLYQNVFNVSGTKIKVLRFVIIYIHQEGLVCPLRVTLADNLGRENAVIVFLRTLKSMGVIPDGWLKINTQDFAQ